MKRCSPTLRKKRSARAGILREELAQVLARRERRERLQRRRADVSPVSGRSHARKPPSNALSLWPRRNAVGQLVEQPHVAAAEHDVFRGHRGAQQLGAFEHGRLPRALRRAPSSRAGRAGPRTSDPCTGSARARARRRGHRRRARCRARNRGRGTACGRLRRCRAPASPRR